MAQDKLTVILNRAKLILQIVLLLVALGALIQADRARLETSKEVDTILKLTEQVRQEVGTFCSFPTQAENESESDPN